MMIATRRKAPYVRGEPYLLTCRGCGDGFENHNSLKKYCSYECLRDSHKLPTLGQQGVPSSTVGALNELRVAADLLARGYQVFRALSPACACDLIIYGLGGEPSKPLRVEVKTAYKRKAGKTNYAPVRDSAAYDVLAKAFPDEIVYDPPLDTIRRG